MKKLAALILSVALALPATAEIMLSEASGNWAGASHQGFAFLARLTQEKDMARLRIWTGTADMPPTGQGDPDLDNTGIELSAFATRQELAVVDTADGSELHLITEFADEAAEGQIVLRIQFIDNQYTVLGYHYQESAYGDGEPIPYDCNVDFQNESMVEDGMEFALNVDSGLTNASGWTHSIAFDRSICSVD